jgi:sporulation protein YlmC with PRC-barrel domain
MLAAIVEKPFSRVLPWRISPVVKVLIGVIVVTAVEVNTCSAQAPAAGNPAPQPRPRSQHGLLRATQLRGTPVIDLVGTPLGLLDDLLVEVESSRAAAILVRPKSEVAAAGDDLGEVAEAAPIKVVPASLANYHPATDTRPATVQITIPGASTLWRDAPKWPPVDAAGARVADRLTWLDGMYHHFGRAWQRPCVDRWWGWGPAGDYNALFTPERNVELRGTVLGVAATWPVCVSSPGVRLWMEVEGLVWGIDLGPVWHVVNEGLEFEPGKALEVRGAEALITPERIVLAVEITYEGRTLRLRADDGVPVWGAAAPVATLRLFGELESVKTVGGEALGRVVDVAIDPVGWSVAYAALESAADAQSLTAVPASLLTADPAGDGLLVAGGASSARAAGSDTAPKIETARWADALDAAFARRVASHYGVPFPGQPACTHVATNFAPRGMFAYALGRVIAIEPCAVPAGAAPPDRWTLKLLTSAGPAWVTFDAEPVRKTDLEIAIGDVVSAWGWPDVTRRCELHAGVLEANGRYLRVRDAAP